MCLLIPLEAAIYILRKLIREFHDFPFAARNILRENDVEVVYLEDLMAEVLELNSNIEDKFIKQ